MQVLELCTNEISDLSELCDNPPRLVHLGLGFNQLMHTEDFLTVHYWSVRNHKAQLIEMALAKASIISSSTHKGHRGAVAPGDTFGGAAL